MKRFIGWLLCWVLAAGSLPAQEIIVGRRRAPSGGGTTPTAEKWCVAIGAFNSATDCTWNGGGSNTAGSMIIAFVWSNNTHAAAPSCAGCSAFTADVSSAAGQIITGGAWWVYSLVGAASVTKVTFATNTFDGYNLYAVSVKDIGSGKGVYDSTAGYVAKSTPASAGGTCPSTCPWSELNAGGTMQIPAAGNLTNAHSFILKASVGSYQDATTFTETDGDSGTSWNLASNGGGLYWRYVITNSAVVMNGTWSSTLGTRYEVMNIAYSAQ